MPLTLASVGSVNLVRHIGGTAEVKKHLSDLGFTAGCEVTVISEMGSNLIVKVKESRVALSREIAARIIV